MAEVCVLQNVHGEDLGIIAQLLPAYNLEPRYVRANAGEPIPRKIGDVAAIVVLGGPMGVYDHQKYPFILDELRLLEQALAVELPILGICLGSQLLALALGAEVKQASRKEIGWHTVVLDENAYNDSLWNGAPGEFVAYHWHGDTFDLPAGATSLASSKLTPTQAFVYGERHYGILCHLEVTERIVRAMVGNFADELWQEQINGAEILRRGAHLLPLLQGVGYSVFQNWAGLIGCCSRANSC